MVKTCLVCKGEITSIGCVNVCTPCGAKVDARRAMYNWFLTRKLFENKLVNKLEREKSKKSKDENVSIEGRIANTLDSGYYKFMLDKCEADGDSHYGLVEGLHYGKGTITDMTEWEIKSFKANYAAEKRRIKENSELAESIYHYSNEFNGSQNIDFIDDMIAFESRKQA